MASMETIVVAYDDPESSTLQRAADLARSLGSKLVVTNVAQPAEGVSDADRRSRERLEEARAFLDEHGVSAEFVTTVGSPGEAIVELARERGADLIVVGTRRKRFFERLVEGSVLQDVVRSAVCDVLVVT